MEIESKRMKNIHHTDNNHNKTGVAILKSDKVDFRAQKKKKQRQR